MSENSPLSRREMIEVTPKQACSICTCNRTQTGNLVQIENMVCVTRSFIFLCFDCIDRLYQFKE